jgi:hypothetical protein
MTPYLPGLSQLIASLSLLSASLGTVWLIHSGAFDKRVKTPAENQWECLLNAEDRFKINACQQAYKDDAGAK